MAREREELRRQQEQLRFEQEKRNSFKRGREAEHGYALKVVLVFLGGEICYTLCVGQKLG